MGVWKILRYAITGHTSGIGKELFNKLLPNCKGFSLSTGYDIRKLKDRTRIIQESFDCDIFINNAPADFGQSELLFELWKEWKDTNKTIINVGSRIADNNVNLGAEHTHLLEYAMHKRTLRRMFEDLQLINTSVDVKYVTFAYVGTERILKKYPHFTESDYITVEKAMELILNA